MKRLSIIVPIYNVEPYVERCLRSLEDQDIPTEDFEIICINDGSPDNSRDVVIRLQKEFNNIILIDQKNQGVSRARNNGIEKASGRYLLFIDPDDYIDKNRFEQILDDACSQNVQVYFLGFTFLKIDGTIRKSILYDEYKNKIFKGTDAYHIARLDGQTDPDRMVAMLFETEFMNSNNLRYLPDVPYLEDGEFIARILCLAQCCIFDGFSFYQRTTRPGSATNSKLFQSQKAVNGFLLAANNLKRFQQQKSLSEKQIDFLNQPICKFVILAISSAGNPFRFKRIKMIKSKLKESGLNILCLNSVDKEYSNLGNLYNKSVFILIVYQYLLIRVRFVRNQILNWKRQLSKK